MYISAALHVAAKKHPSTPISTPKISVDWRVSQYFGGEMDVSSM